MEDDVDDVRAVGVRPLGGHQRDGPLELVLIAVLRAATRDAARDVAHALLLRLKREGGARTLLGLRGAVGGPLLRLGVERLADRGEPLLEPRVGEDARRRVAVPLEGDEVECVAVLVRLTRGCRGVHRAGGGGGGGGTPPPRRCGRNPCRGTDVLRRPPDGEFLRACGSARPHHAAARPRRRRVYRRPRRLQCAGNAGGHDRRRNAARVDRDRRRPRLPSRCCWGRRRAIME
mmetsp:Transcript_16188/g.50205  ORF Transcript_16188/g.50205 Transcript_16188/m.50205 type:complete len:232 (+) Transcript_16188:479-1174(+)